jgi:hypothetical protein
MPGLFRVCRQEIAARLTNFPLAHPPHAQVSPMTDRDIVRSLAAQLAEAAHSDEMASRRKLWRDVHSLRLPERPPCIVHPGCWHELIPDSAYVCSDPWLRGLEAQMRQWLYKLTIGDDTVINPYWEVHTVMDFQGEHFWGLPIGYTHSGVARGAWAYEPPIREESDLDRIVSPKYVYNAKATAESLERHDELLGDTLPVQRTCTIPTPGAWLHGWATQLRGVTQLLMDMMDRPQWVHRFMTILRDGNLALLDQYEQQGVLTPNTGWFWECDDLMDVEGPNTGGGRIADGIRPPAPAGRIAAIRLRLFGPSRCASKTSGVGARARSSSRSARRSTRSSCSTTRSPFSRALA